MDTHDWESFYLIVGTAGATLIGIQFVVMTLVASLRTGKTSEGSLGAFATPTVVHFGIVIAGAAFALLLIGTHNAWDTVTYLVLGAHADNSAG